MRRDTQHTLVRMTTHLINETQTRPPNTPSWPSDGEHAARPHGSQLRPAQLSERRRVGVKGAHERDEHGGRLRLGEDVGEVGGTGEEDELDDETSDIVAQATVESVGAGAP